MTPGLVELNRKFEFTPTATGCPCSVVSHARSAPRAKDKSNEWIVSRAVSRNGCARDILGDLRHAIVIGLADFIDEVPAGLRGHFQRAGEPEHQRAVQQGIADEEQEHHGQERNRDGAQNHFCFEARAGLVRAPLRPEPQQTARQDKAENKKRRHDERRERIQNQNFVPPARLKGKSQGAERKYGREQQGDRQATEAEQ